MPMNYLHRKLCSSTKWADKVAEAMPTALADFDLGDNLLEIGPGFGATTKALTTHYSHQLTALEIDEASVRHLREQLGDRAEIMHGSGADMPFEDDTFSAVVCFTMLHHVPTVAMQDAIFAEAYRVLRKGGLFRGTDSQPSLRFRLLHIGDTMNVLNPATLQTRLAAAGFDTIDIEHVPKQQVRFSSIKPN